MVQQGANIPWFFVGSKKRRKLTCIQEKITHGDENYSYSIHRNGKMMKNEAPKQVSFTRVRAGSFGASWVPCASS